MDDQVREELISQAKAKALSILSDRLERADGIYDPEPNSMVIGTAINEICKEFVGLDSDDVAAAALAAYHEWFVGDHCEVFSKATEHIQSAYQAGLDAGYEFGTWCSRYELVDDFEQYMKHVHKGDSDAVSVFHGFAKWWKDGIGDGGPLVADLPSE